MIRFNIPVTLTFWLAITVGALSAQDFKVHFIDVGQGGASLIEFPNGAILYDAGAQDDQYTLSLIKYLDDFFLKRPDLNRTLDAVVISHYHIDHVRSLKQILANFKVNVYVDNGTPEKGIIKTYRNSALEQLKVTNGTYLAITDKLISNTSTTGYSSKLFSKLSRDAKAEIRFLSGGKLTKPALWNQNEFTNQNSHSVIMRVDYGEASYLFTGDLEDQALTDLVDQYKRTSLLAADVLLVNFHGSELGKAGANFFKEVSPEVGVISVGKWHSGYGDESCRFCSYYYGHPRVSTIEALGTFVTSYRPPVVRMAAIKSREFTEVKVEKAIYTTGWDGTVIVSANAAGKLTIGTFPTPYISKLAEALGDNEKNNLDESKTKTINLGLTEDEKIDALLKRNPELKNLNTPEPTSVSVSGTPVKSNADLERYYFYIGFPKNIVQLEETQLELRVGGKDQIQADMNREEFQSVILDSIFFENINISIEITGNGIDAKPFNKGPQTLDLKEISAFLLQMTPKKSDSLAVRILFIKHLTATSTRTFPIIKHTIFVKAVKSNWYDPVVNFIKSEWKWLWATILVPLALWLWRLTFPKKPKLDKADTTKSSIEEVRGPLEIRFEFFGKIGSNGEFSGRKRVTLKNRVEHILELLAVEKVSTLCDDIHLKEVRTLDSSPGGIQVKPVTKPSVTKIVIKKEGQDIELFTLQYQLKLTPGLSDAGDFVTYEVLIDSSDHAKDAFTEAGACAMCIISEQNDFTSNTLVAPEGYAFKIIRAWAEDSQGKRKSFSHLKQVDPIVDTNDSRLYMKLDNPPVGYKFQVQYRLAPVS